MFTALRRLLRPLLRRRQLEQEMAEEMRFHLEAQTAAHRRDGLPPAEAAAAAQRQFGHVTGLQEKARDARGGRWLHDLVQDLRYGLRQLRRQPGFAFAAVLTLGLGLGASTTIFSVLDAVVLRPLSVPDADRLVSVWETNLARNVTQFSTSHPNFIDWRERSQSWEELAAFDQRAIRMLHAGEPQRLFAEYQTANALALLGVEVALGRGFRPGEDAAGQGDIVILSDGLWRRAFAADTRVLGRTLTLEGRPHTIVGVAPAGAGFMRTADVFLPLGPIIEPDRTDHGLGVCGRLRPGVTLAQAQAEMSAIARQIEREHPEENAGWSVRLEPFFDTVVGHDVRRALYVLLGAVALLLAIACANVSGLLLVRATTRTRELTIRTALGGGRGRLIRQLITESVLLAGLGGALGLGFAAWAIDFFRHLDGANLPRADEIGLDGRVLAVGWGVAVVTGVFAGLVPALAASRVDLVQGLKDGAQPGRTRTRGRHALLVGQLALSIVLLACAGLMARTLDQLQRRELGFRPEHVLTLRVAPAEDRKAFFAQLIERVAQLPDVQAVGVSSTPPMADYNTSLNVFSVGPARLAPTESLQAEWRIVDAGYFRTLQIPLRRGRVFTPADNEHAPRRVVVNETFARQMWGDADPIGQQVNPGGGDDHATVIGVVGDIRSRDPAVPPTAGYYLPAYRFVWGQMTLVVRMSGDPSRLTAAIRQEVRALDATLPVFAVEPLESLIDRRLARPRLVTGLLTGFAALALVLASVGLYGAMAFATAQRTREIGIRLALGAQPAAVLRPLLGEAARLVALGTGLGLALALAATHLMRGVLTDVAPTDPLSFGVALGLLILAALLACYLPARRALRVDPLTALRLE